MLGAKDAIRIVLFIFFPQSGRYMMIQLLRQKNAQRGSFDLIFTLHVFVSFLGFMSFMTFYFL